MNSLDEFGVVFKPRLHCIRVKLGKYKERSKENPERYLVYIDGKPLEIMCDSFEFIANTNHTNSDDIDDGFVVDLQESLERIKGTKGIISISITEHR